MKKFFKIGCLGLVILFGIAIVLIAIQKWNDAPTQSVMFINTSESVKSVTFERIGEDGKISDTYTVDENIKPNKTVIKFVTEGTYKISVWNDDKTLYDTSELTIKLPDSNKSNHQLYRFDLAMDKIYAIVQLNALYEGNSFADHMSNAVGTKQKKLKIEELYDGHEPFFVPETYTFRTFVDVDDEKIPTKVDYGVIVYGLFAFPKKLEKEKIYDELLKQISDKM